MDATTLTVMRAAQAEGIRQARQSPLARRIARAARQALGRPARRSAAWIDGAATDAIATAARAAGLREPITGWVRCGAPLAALAAAYCGRYAEAYGLDTIGGGGLMAAGTPTSAQVDGCQCDCQCGAAATTTDEGVQLCEACATYMVDDAGDTVCSRVADGRTCHVCREVIQWGTIQTGQPGEPNQRLGECGCGWCWSETEHGGDWRLGYEAEG